MNIFHANFVSYSKMAEPYAESFYDKISHFQYLHNSYLFNVKQHLKFNWDLYLTKKEIPPTLKFYELEDQPMITVPLFNAAERIKALKPFFDTLHEEFPHDIVFGPEFPKFDFPACWIKEKTEEFVYNGKAIQINYKYI